MSLRQMQVSGRLFMAQQHLLHSHQLARQHLYRQQEGHLLNFPTRPDQVIIYTGGRHFCDKLTPSSNSAFRRGQAGTHTASRDIPKWVILRF